MYLSYERIAATKVINHKSVQLLLTFVFCRRKFKNYSIFVIVLRLFWNLFSGTLSIRLLTINSVKLSAEFCRTSEKVPENSIVGNDFFSFRRKRKLFIFCVKGEVFLVLFDFMCHGSLIRNFSILLKRS